MQKHTNIKRTAYGIGGSLFVLAIVVASTSRVLAAPAYTPYANSVNTQAGTVTNPNNAVGAPDNQRAMFVGSNPSLTLDMGEGEEGTNSLKVYIGPVSVQTNVSVEFLDASQTVISSDQQALFLNMQASTQNFAYNWHDFGKAYRFVRLSTQTGTGLSVDAIEALGFIGSSATQDTDGDGIPDRQDTSPLVPNASGGGSGSGGGATTGGGLTTNTTVVRTVSTNSSAGPTTPVNSPPATSNDKDGDQMDDTWETTNGLNPGDKNDAKADPDKDGLTNLREYQFGTNPKKADTDGDGMPDGWEVDNGLNARVDDAQQDPDNDYLTNLGEYHFKTNPFSADKVSLRTMPIMGSWLWWLGAALVLVIVMSFVCGKLMRPFLPNKNTTKTNRPATKPSRVFWPKG